jgi:hypothetical protein
MTPTIEQNVKNDKPSGSGIILQQKMQTTNGDEPMRACDS